MKAIGYIRVSTEEQAKRGISLEVQREKIRAYCELKDMELVRIFSDPGKSAKNLNRPGMQKLLKMVNEKKIDAVIIWKLDRMFRSVINSLETTQLFDKQGIGFHSISESIDTKSAMGRFFFTLLSAVAELERGQISERVSSALQYLKKNGRRAGAVAYGWEADLNGKLYQNKEEQRIITKIKNYRELRFNYSKIAQLLNDKDILTKNGKAWFPQSVKNVLKYKEGGVK